MASTDSNDTDVGNTAQKKKRTTHTTTTKPTAGMMALTKLGVILENMLEFTRAHRNTHVVLKDGVSEAHVLLRVFQLSRKTPGNLASPGRFGKPSVREISCQADPAPLPPRMESPLPKLK